MSTLETRPGSIPLAYDEIFTIAAEAITGNTGTYTTHWAPQWDQLWGYRQWCIVMEARLILPAGRTATLAIQAGVLSASDLASQSQSNVTGGNIYPAIRCVLTASELYAACAGCESSPGLLLGAYGRDAGANITGYGMQLYACHIDDAPEAGSTLIA